LRERGRQKDAGNQRQDPIQTYRAAHRDLLDVLYTLYAVLKIPQAGSLRWGRAECPDSLTDSSLTGSSLNSDEHVLMDYFEYWRKKRFKMP
jgi:hypothetical protein